MCRKQSAEAISAAVASTASMLGPFSTSERSRQKWPRSMASYTEGGGGACRREVGGDGGRQESWVEIISVIAGCLGAVLHITVAEPLVSAGAKSVAY